MGKLDNEKIFLSLDWIGPDLIEEASEPAKREKNNITWLKRTVQAAAGLAAAFVLLVGACCISPALAASIPGMETIVTLLKGRVAGPVESGTLETMFSNFRYYDDWRQAGIADEDMRQEPEYYEHMMEAEDQTFVLCDVTVNARELAADRRVDMSQITADGKKDGDLVLWICNIARPWMDHEIDVYKNPAFTAEIEYFSLHSTGETDYYHFAIGPNETLTVQIGFFAPTSELNKGTIVLASDYDGHRNVYLNQYPVPPRD